METICDKISKKANERVINLNKIYYGGSILTLSENLYTEAVLVSDGKIQALGSLLELKAACPDAEPVNLNGKCMMPAFIDPHSHLSQMAAAEKQISLNGAESVSQISQRINSFISQHKPPKGSWLMARDYDNNLLPESKNPGISVLDSLAPGYKLIIHHKSGHMGLLNSEALAALNISADDPSPGGGMIGRENGQLTGYLEENAFFNALQSLPPEDPESLIESYVKAQDKYAENGICLIQEGMFVRQMLPMLKALLESGSIKLPVRIYCDMDSYDDLQALLKKYDADVTVCGLKVYLDGSPQGRTAWMLEPYENSGDYCGYGCLSDAQLIAAFKFAAENHLQLLAHCNGDAAAEQFLRCLEQAEQDYPKLSALRPVIIHGQLIKKEQLLRAKKLGACVSFFGAHVRYWGDVHVKNFGIKRASGISPANSALKAGVNFTFHQDSPVLPPNMLETVKIATERKTASSLLLGEDERISTLEALKAVTINAAWQYFEENLRGSLQKGKEADFIILSQDPLKAQDIERITVESLYIHGEKYKFS